MDLKLENILLNENNEPVLCDFGFSTQNNYTNLTWDKVEKQNLKKQGLPIIHEKNDIFSKIVEMFD